MRRCAPCQMDADGPLNVTLQHLNRTAIRSAFAAILHPCCHARCVPYGFHFVFEFQLIQTKTQRTAQCDPSSTASCFSILATIGTFVRPHFSITFRHKAIVRLTNKAERDRIDAFFHADDNIVPILLGQRINVNLRRRKIDPLVRVELAANDDATVNIRRHSIDE